MYVSDFYCLSLCWQWAFYLIDTVPHLDLDRDVLLLAADVKTKQLFGGVFVAEFVEGGQLLRHVVIPYGPAKKRKHLLCAVLELDGAQTCCIPLKHFREQKHRTVWAIKRTAIADFKLELPRIPKKK